MLLEQQVNIITDKVIQRLLEGHNPNPPDNSFDIRYVYHAARQGDIDKIFTYGFESFFVGKGVGNMYGRGVYTTSDLESSIYNAKKGTYGSIIVRCELQSYDRFLIWEPAIAKKVYGHKWRMRDQLEMLLPEYIDDMKSSTSGGNAGFSNLYDLMTRIKGHTSLAAHQFWLYCRSSSRRNGNPWDKVLGLVFFGLNDGHVAVIKDVKNPIPLDYSSDYGATWQNARNDETLRYTKQDFDVDLHYGKKYDKTTPPEFGWAKVEKNGKVNYINRQGKEISKTWFEAGSNFIKYSDDLAVAKILFNGEFAYLGSDALIYEELGEDPVCSADDLSDV